MENKVKSHMMETLICTAVGVSPKSCECKVPSIKGHSPDSDHWLCECGGWLSGMVVSAKEISTP